MIDDNILIEAYRALISAKDYRRSVGYYITMDELFKYLRATSRKSLTLVEFKATMQDFYQRRSPNDYEFARASSIRPEVRRYAFEISGRHGGLYYLMRLVKYHATT